MHRHAHYRQWFMFVQNRVSCLHSADYRLLRNLTDMFHPQAWSRGWWPQPCDYCDASVQHEPPSCHELYFGSPWQPCQAVLRSMDENSDLWWASWPWGHNVLRWIRKLGSCQWLVEFWGLSSDFVCSVIALTGWIPEPSLFRKSWSRSPGKSTDTIETWYGPGPVQRLNLDSLLRRQQPIFKGANSKTFQSWTWGCIIRNSRG